MFLMETLDLGGIYINKNPMYPKENSQILVVPRSGGLVKSIVIDVGSVEIGCETPVDAVDGSEIRPTS